MRSKNLTHNQWHCKWGDQCSNFQQKISNHGYKTEKIYPLLGHVRIKDHFVELRDNVRKYLSDAEHTLNTKELIIARHDFTEGLTKRNDNKQFILKSNDVEI